MTTFTRAGGCAGTNYPFLTLKERDNETGLDYFLARYYSSTQGRFTSSDEFSGGPEELYEFDGKVGHNPTFYAELEDPQSLNKYHYALNNPLRYIDPDGHQTTTTDRLKAGAADFITGVGRGISSSISYGASGAPQESDSLVNRAGQGVGTIITSLAGRSAIGGGIVITGGSGGLAAEVGVPLVVAGATVMVGSTLNAVKIATTPMQRNSSETYSSDDVERMKQGKAPTGSDGNPKELHHPDQNPKAPVREMTRSDHRGKGNYTKNHPKGNKQPSQIDRQKFKKERERYWKNKAKEQEQK